MSPAQFAPVPEFPKIFPTGGFRTRQPCDLTGFLIALSVVAVMFLLPAFVRQLRPVSPILALALQGCLFLTILIMTRSVILMSLVMLVTAMAVGIWVQDTLGHVPSLSLAARQIFYYVHLVLGTVSAVVLVSLHRDTAFSARMILIAMVLYGALSALGSAKFAGGYDIRGNFECGTVYFMVAFLFLTCRKPLGLTIFLLAFGMFSVATSSSQGVLFALVTFALYILPVWGRCLICAFMALIPVLFPLVLGLTVDSVSSLDSNVAIRDQLWSGLYSYLGEYGHGFGFGAPVYEMAMEQLGRDYIKFENIRNIGMHNAPLQITAFLGYPGMMLAIVFISLTTWIAIRNADDIRVVGCFVALMITLTLNQAITHLAVSAGTELLLGVLVWAEIHRTETAPASPFDRRLRRTIA